MATMLADNQEKVVFQCDMMAQIRKVNKVEYAVFEGHHNNGAAVVDFEIRMRIEVFLQKECMEIQLGGLVLNWTTF